MLLSTILHDTMRVISIQGRVPLEVAAVVGFIGGFAERLVPNILRQTVAKIEPADGTPVQAVRSQSSQSTVRNQATPPPVEKR